MAAAGAAAPEIEAAVNDAAERTTIYFVPETLEFLQRGGRLGRAQALAGTLLKIKPILEIKHGEVHPVERVRTFHGACRRVIELISTLGKVERLGIMHGDAPEGAADVQRQLAAHFPQNQIDIGELGSVLGTHAGPGIVGVAAMRAP
jgi:DegV family protein with EDD domain